METQLETKWREIMRWVKARALQLEATGVDRSAAMIAAQAEGKNRFPDYHEAASAAGKVGRAKQMALKVKPAQPMLGLDAKAVADDVESTLRWNGFHLVLYEKFGWAPNDQMVSAICELAGNPPPSGANNANSGRQNARAHGWVEQRSQDGRIWTAHLDPNHKKRLALQKQLENAEREAIEHEQAVAELKRKLKEIGAKV